MLADALSFLLTNQREDFDTNDDIVTHASADIHTVVYKKILSTCMCP